MGRRQDRPFYRTYTIKIINGKRKNILITWIQRRCKVCGRYIGGIKQFLCKRCYNRRHNNRIRKYVHYYGIEAIRRILDNISIPSYLRNSLRGYL